MLFTYGYSFCRTSDFSGFSRLDTVRLPWQRKAGPESSEQLLRPSVAKTVEGLTVRTDSITSELPVIRAEFRRPNKRKGVLRVAGGHDSRRAAATKFFFLSPRNHSDCQ
jgi:hypothetical protein